MFQKNWYNLITLSAEAVEYADCISAYGSDSLPSSNVKYPFIAITP